MLKQLPRRAVSLLALIYTACISAQYFPTAWKSRDRDAYPETGQELASPRELPPHLALPVPRKILERIILNRIRRDFEERSYQGNAVGFQEKSLLRTSSSKLRLLRLFLLSTAALSQLSSLTILSPLILFTTLYFCINSVTQFVFNIITSYPTSRTFTVSYQCHTWSPRPIVAGVPKGAVLSPLPHLSLHKRRPHHRESQ